MKPVYRVAAVSRRVKPSASLSVTTSRPSRRGGDLFDPSLSAWQPGLQSADADWLGVREPAVARIRDLVHNEPWAQAGLDAKAVSAIGARWKWSSRPDFARLGIQPGSDAALRLSMSQESALRRWAEDPAFRCDHYRSLTLSPQLFLTAMHLFRDGEGLALLNYTSEDDGFPFSTRLQLIDPDRLSNPDNRPDDDVYRGGVELDAEGRPVAVHIRRSHPGDIGLASFTAQEWERFPIRESWGRPRVLHLFDRERIGQHRGVSRLVATLRRFKKLESFSDAELETAVNNAEVFATIYSDTDSAFLAEALGDVQTLNNVQKLSGFQKGFYEEAPARFGRSRAVRLFPGDKLDLNAQGRASSEFGNFTSVLLQSLAAGLGLTYEQLSKDFSRTNYSSARAALIEAWRVVERERALIQDQFANPIVLAVLEEAHDKGMIDLPPGAPEFWDDPHAYARGRWIAPPRGAIDPVKERVGNEMAVQTFEKTYEDTAAEGGRDLDEVIAEQASILRRMDDAGLDPIRLGELLAAARASASSPDADV